MASRLFGANSSPQEMFTYCQLNHWEQIPMELEYMHKHENSFQGN